jgi:hypothetical protein
MHRSTLTFFIFSPQDFKQKEHTMKTKHGLSLGFAVLLLAVIFTFSSCGDGAGDDDGGGGNNPTLVGKWYDTQAHADADGTDGLKYTFKTNGDLFYGDATESQVTWTTSANTIKVNGHGETNITAANFAFSETTLTLTNSNSQVGFSNGIYYKKAQ